MWIAMEKLLNVRGNYGVFGYFWLVYLQSDINALRGWFAFRGLGSSLALNSIALAMRELGVRSAMKLWRAGTGKI